MPVANSVTFLSVCGTVPIWQEFCDPGAVITAQQSKTPSTCLILSHWDM